eukprot:3413998-Amphidinium_carterae.1
MSSAKLIRANTTAGEATGHTATSVQRQQDTLEERKCLPTFKVRTLMLFQALFANTPCRDNIMEKLTWRIIECLSFKKVNSPFSLAWRCNFNKNNQIVLNAQHGRAEASQHQARATSLTV